MIAHHAKSDRLLQTESYWRPQSGEMIFKEAQRKSTEALKSCRNIQVATLHASFLFLSETQRLRENWFSIHGADEEETKHCLSPNPSIKATLTSHTLPTRPGDGFMTLSTLATSKFTLTRDTFLQIHCIIYRQTFGLFEWVSNVNAHPTITLLNFLSGNMLLDRQDQRETNTTGIWNNFLY